MDEPIPTVGTTGPEDFSTKSGETRKRLRKQFQWQAEWAAKGLPAGAVIFGLRTRAKSSQNRATVFLVLLFLTVVVGIAYFVGEPAYRTWVERQTNAARALEQGDLNRQAAILDGRLNELKSEAEARALEIWRRENRPATFFRVDFVDAKTGWATGTRRTILRTTDGGQEWTLQSLDGPGLGIFGRLIIQNAAFADAETGWVLLSDGQILQTTDGGDSWKVQYDLSYSLLELRTIFSGMAFADAQLGLVAGAGGTILRTEDGGATWTEPESGTDANLFDVAFTDAGKAVAVGEGGTILRTEDGGVTWTVRDSGTDLRLIEIAFADASNGWIMSSETIILRTEDGGVTWEPFESGPATNFYGFAFANASDGLALQDDGTILRTEDGGITCKPQDSGTIAELYDVTFADARNAWAVGEDGTILYSEDGGVTWKSQYQPEIVDPTDDTEWNGIAVQRAQTPSALQSAIALSGIDGIPDDFALKLANLVRDRGSLDSRQRSLPSESASEVDQAVLTASRLLQTAGDADSVARAQAAFDSALRLKELSEVWWRNLDVRIPAGILLLFLLATLGSLYRYNTRIAGFYHARADALELMALESPPDRERFEALAGTLAADRVEFRAAKTLADMATEITKEVIAKLDLKRSD